MHPLRSLGKSGVATQISVELKLIRLWDDERALIKAAEDCSNVSGAFPGVEDLRFALYSSGNLPDSHAGSSYLRYFIYFPLFTRKVDYNPQSGLLNLGSVSATTGEGHVIPLGNYETSFADLSEVTGNFENLPIKDVVNVIRAEKNRTAERVEILGVQIPGRKIRLLGSLAAIVIQLYFLLYLHALGKSLRNQDDTFFPYWLPLFDGWLPRLSFVLVFLLPTPIILLFLSVNSDLNLNTFLGLTATAVSLLLAWKSIRVFNSIWRRAN